MDQVDCQCPVLWVHMIVRMSAELAAALLGLVAQLLHGVEGVVPADHVAEAVLAAVHVHRQLAAQLDAAALHPLVGSAELTEAVVLQRGEDVRRVGVLHVERVDVLRAEAGVLPQHVRVGDLRGVVHRHRVLELPEARLRPHPDERYRALRQVARALRRGEDHGEAAVAHHAEVDEPQRRDHVADVHVPVLGERVAVDRQRVERRGLRLRHSDRPQLVLGGTVVVHAAAIVEGRRGARVGEPVDLVEVAAHVVDAAAEAVAVGALVRAVDAGDVVAHAARHQQRGLVHGLAVVGDVVAHLRLKPQAVADLLDVPGVAEAALHEQAVDVVLLEPAVRERLKKRPDRDVVGTVLGQFPLRRGAHAGDAHVAEDVFERHRLPPLGDLATSPHPAADARTLCRRQRLCLLGLSDFRPRVFAGPRSSRRAAGRQASAVSAEPWLHSRRALRFDAAPSSGPVMSTPESAGSLRRLPSGSVPFAALCCQPS